MLRLPKHFVALDHMIVAMASLSEGKPVTAAKHMQQALKSKDFKEMFTTLDSMNVAQAAPTAQASDKPSLEQALAIVAKSVKSKKADKKKKKKAKANSELTISEVEIEDLDITEDDLLDTGDDSVDSLDDGDLDLNDLALDDDDEELAGDEDDSMEGDDLILEDDDEDVTEMPEATSAEALGTDKDIKPGKDGAPKATDHGEPPTTVKKEAVPAPESAKTTKASETEAAQRLLANIQLIEQQSARKPATAK